MYNTVKGQSSRQKKFNREKQWASRTVCISLDFEKWNGHMRREMTHGVFTAIGELFGLPDLYNVTYDLFHECYYYLADGSYVPKYDEDGSFIIEEPWSFTHHRGGMEGLRQKGWTIYTVFELEVILSKYDCTYKIMGMGDNQLLQITVYTKNVGFDGKENEKGLEDMKTIGYIPGLGQMLYRIRAPSQTNRNLDVRRLISIRQSSSVARCSIVHGFKEVNADIPT